MRVAASRVNKTAAATSPHIHWPPGNLVIACLLLVTANTALLGAIHILRQHFLGSLDTLGGVVSTWSAFALTLGTYTLLT